MTVQICRSDRPDDSIPYSDEGGAAALRRLASAGPSPLAVCSIFPRPLILVPRPSFLMVPAQRCRGNGMAEGETPCTCWSLVPRPSTFVSCVCGSIVVPLPSSLIPHSACHAPSFVCVLYLIRRVLCFVQCGVAQCSGRAEWVYLGRWAKSPIPNEHQRARCHPLSAVPCSR